MQTGGLKYLLCVVLVFAVIGPLIPVATILLVDPPFARAAWGTGSPPAVTAGLRFFSFTTLCPPKSPAGGSLRALFFYSVFGCVSGMLGIALYAQILPLLGGLVVDTSPVYRQWFVVMLGAIGGCGAANVVSLVRQHPPGGRLPGLSVIIVCFVLAPVAWFAPLLRFTISTSEYPALLAACQEAPPAEREKMIRVVSSAASKTAIFNFTHGERAEFLLAGGYCVGGWFEKVCKPVPIGTEADGIAIEIFGRVACHAPPPTPNRCVPGETSFRC